MNRRKVILITTQDSNNYGSTLQVFASQKILEMIGYDVQIVNYLRKQHQRNNEYTIWTNGDNAIETLLKRIILIPTFKKWKKVFWGFMENNINLTAPFYSEKQLESHPPKGDVYCTGSDQVWNSTWNNGIEEPYFLKWVPEGKKKISFSSSIGKSVIDDKEKLIVKSFLQTYDAISVREDSAVRVLEDMGIESVHVLDPTLLLSKEFWITFSGEKKIKDKYVLIYQLNRNREFDRYAIKFAKLKKCKLVRFCTRYDQIRLPADRHVFIPDVNEFVSLINGAEYILTDSFHATSFGLNLNKEIICVYPLRFNSRLDDILKDTGMQHRHLVSYEDFAIANNSTDFANINQYLQEERSKAFEFLRNAIE